MRSGIWTPPIGNRPPLWPFVLNRDSPQADHLVRWYPVLPFGIVAPRDLATYNDATINNISDTTLETDVEVIHAWQKSGTTDAFDIPKLQEIVDAGKYTIQIIVKFPSSPNSIGRQSFYSDDVSGNVAVSFSWDHNNASFQQAWAHRQSNGTYVPVKYSSISIDTWHWFTVRWDSIGGTVEIFNQGLIDTSTGITNGTIQTMGSSGDGHLLFHAGGVSRTQFMAEIRVYDAILSDALIYQMWNPATRWDLYYPIGRRIYSFPAAAAPAVIVGLAIETDLAQTITRAKLKQLGLATETNTALAATIRRTFTIGQAIETDLGFNLTRLKTVSGGLPIETDIAFAVTAGNQIDVGLAVESDIAFAITAQKTRAIGLATETDLGFTVQPLRTVAIGQAFETDLGFTITRQKTQAIGIATEIDTGLATSVVRTLQVGQAVETDVGFPVDHSKSIQIQIASERDVALDITVIGGVAAGPGGEIGFLTLYRRRRRLTKE